MLNTTGDSTSLNVSSTNIEKPPYALLISLKFVNAWIIGANGIVLLTLVLNRHALKKFVNLQLLSLSVTDILVGLTFIPIIMTFEGARSFTTYWSCATTLCVYTVAQQATIHHALAICIYRLLKVKWRRLSPETDTAAMYKYLCLQISIPWIESLVYCVTVFGIHGHSYVHIRACSLNEVFQEDYMTAMIVFNFNTVLPHVAMDVIYIYLLVFLLRKWKRVNAMRNMSCLSMAPSGSDNLQASASTSDETPASKRTDTYLKVGVERKGTSQVKASIIRNERAGKGIRNNRVFNSEMTRRGVEITNREVQAHNATTVIHARANTGLRDEKRVLITIGILLLVLNVFMTPVSLIPLAEAFARSPLSRTAKFIMVLFPLINSIFNPLIYIWRIKPFREVFGAAWKNMRAKCCFYH